MCCCSVTIAIGKFHWRRWQHYSTLQLKRLYRLSAFHQSTRGLAAA
jgi:hypothetical protein